MKRNSKSFFNDTAEIEIYNYVCRERKKCPREYIEECNKNNLEPISWKGWKSHVINTINDYTDEKKEELLHYLVSKKRVMKSSISIITGFVYALFAAIGASLYVSCFNCGTDIKFIANFIFSIIFICILFFAPYRMADSYQQRYSFYKDYINILKHILVNNRP